MKGRTVGLVDSKGRDRVQTVNNEPSMTVQSDAHLADMNTIMESFAAGGLQALDEADLMFRDVSEFTDLRDALDQAREAEVEFMKLPSKVREVFEHDVAVWLDTAHDADKRQALVTAGFLTATPVVVDPPVVPPPPVQPPIVPPAGETRTSPPDGGEASASE